VNSHISSPRHRRASEASFLTGLPKCIVENIVGEPMSSLEKLKAAFVSAIGIPATAEFDNLAYGQTTGWDSIAHMSLINEIESNFDIMLDTDDVIDMSSFAKAREILGKYGVAFA
jgi:acyl carrier protein